MVIFVLPLISVLVLRPWMSFIIMLVLWTTNGLFKTICLWNFETFFSLNRRDFRLVIGDPTHPGKAIANPVFWLKGDVVVEVNFFFSYWTKSLSIIQLGDNCHHQGLFSHYRHSNYWLGRILHSSKFSRTRWYCTWTNHWNPNHSWYLSSSWLFRRRLFRHIGLNFLSYVFQFEQKKRERERGIKTEPDILHDII